METVSLKKLQAELGVPFNSVRLLYKAFTHSSYANEHAPHDPGGKIEHNERLEYLGDAVLELAVSQYLYHRYPNKPEGELTKLRASIVCEPSLCHYAKQLNFGQYLRLGRGEELTGGRERPALLADVFEAFVGALYLDQGLPAVERFLDKAVFRHLADEPDRRMSDYKSQLQELTQQLELGPLSYKLAEDRGPAHPSRFVSEVFIAERLYGRGEGRSKKQSEQQAASNALKKLKVLK